VTMTKIQEECLDDALMALLDHSKRAQDEKKTQIKKSGQNRMHHYYVLYTVCHMTMQGLFSNSAENCSQNGI
jgi:hypothetical protein